eukprot:gene2155-1324_t
MPVWVVKREKNNNIYLSIYIYIYIYIYRKIKPVGRLPGKKHFGAHNNKNPNEILIVFVSMDEGRWGASLLFTSQHTTHVMEELEKKMSRNFLSFSLSPVNLVCYYYQLNTASVAAA